MTVNFLERRSFMGTGGEKGYKDKVLYFDLYQSNEVINHKKIRSLVEFRSLWSDRQLAD